MTYSLSDLTLQKIPPLLSDIQSKEQWLQKCERLRAEWEAILGSAPLSVRRERSTPLSVSYEVVEEWEEEDHRRLDIRYATFDGDTVPAFLLLPKKRGAEAKRRHPAVLALHPTAAEGRADVATPLGRENRMYGVELVSRGYIVLAPDSASFGGRVYEGTEPFQTAPFYAKYPSWSMIGKMICDHQRALDVLWTLEEVDTERIGVIGHSLGGYNGWFLAASDQRVRAVVSSCGFSMFTEDPDPNRWGQREWFTHAPVITDYIRQDTIPFEWHEIASLTAPVPMFMWSGLMDRIFPNWAAIAAGMAEIDGLYRFLGHGERFHFVLGNAGHDFPPSIRLLAYDFLDRWLRL
jgi:cephalosporin-C deacetylase-like acetyl esterase